MKRLTDPLEWFIPKREDHKKHLIIGILGLPEYAFMNMHIWLAIWAALTALNELYQKITKTGEASFIDWVYGMIVPVLGYIVVYFS